ncbi:hypothetical protein DFS34DRAFT_596042 [Phlyctochytrium arcticum]|nr:hypothetical protein DFS34DRAFT_596042 [Phlyctochytrium arcticum]
MIGNKKLKRTYTRLDRRKLHFKLVSAALAQDNDSVVALLDDCQTWDAPHPPNPEDPPDPVNKRQRLQRDREDEEDEPSTARGHAMVAAILTGNLALIEILLDAGARTRYHPDGWRESEKKSYLEIAAERGQTAVVGYLLDRGLTPTDSDAMGVEAIKQDNQELTRMLLERKQMERGRALHLSVFYNRLNMIKEFDLAVDEKGLEESAVTAGNLGNLDMLEYLIKHLPVSEHDRVLEEVYHSAGSVAVVEYCLATLVLEEVYHNAGSVAVVEYCLATLGPDRAHPIRPDALHQAMRESHMEVVKHFIAQGVEVDEGQVYNILSTQLQAGVYLYVAPPTEWDYDERACNEDDMLYLYSLLHPDRQGELKIAVTAIEQRFWRLTEAWMSRPDFNVKELDGYSAASIVPILRKDGREDIIRRLIDLGTCESHSMDIKGVLPRCKGCTVAGVLSHDRYGQYGALSSDAARITERLARDKALATAENELDIWKFSGVADYLVDLLLDHTIHQPLDNFIRPMSFEPDVAVQVCSSLRHICAILSQILHMEDRRDVLSQDLKSALEGLSQISQCKDISRFVMERVCPLAHERGDEVLFPTFVNVTNLFDVEGDEPNTLAAIHGGVLDTVQIYTFRPVFEDDSDWVSHLHRYLEAGEDPIAGRARLIVDHAFDFNMPYWLPAAKRVIDHSDPSILYHFWPIMWDPTDSIELYVAQPLLNAAFLQHSPKLIATLTWLGADCSDYWFSKLFDDALSDSKLVRLQDIKLFLKGVEKYQTGVPVFKPAVPPKFKH